MSYTTTIVLLIVLPYLLLSWTSPSSSQSSATNCSLSITITTGGGCLQSCSRLSQSDNGTVLQLQCTDLQSALAAAAEMDLNRVNSSSEDLENASVSNCVAVTVPVGVHFITKPVHFSSTNLHLFAAGGSDSNDTATIFCNYTVDVDESRIFDLDYNYTDYTFYFNRSEAVSFEKLKFIGCPYPIRLDTVADIGVHSSTFQ